MHPQLRKNITASVRRRHEQGDCPSEPAQRQETLEFALMDAEDDLARLTPVATARADHVPITKDAVSYVLRYGGMCRGCADEDGVCPSSGLPCDVPQAERAIRHVLEAVNYGVKNGFLKLET